MLDVGENKVIPVYALPETGDKDHYFSLGLYFCKVPSEVIEKNEWFYLQPITLTSVSVSERCWYYRSPIGKIKKMVKDMCEKASINGNFMDHSL